MTLRELAEALDTPIRTLYNWAAAGRLHVRKGQKGGAATAGTVAPFEIVKLARELEQEHKDRAKKAGRLAGQIERVMQASEKEARG